MTPRVVLLLHGLGGNAAAMRPVARYCRDRLPAASFECLEGPVLLDERNSRGWFDPPRDAHRELEGPHRPMLEGLDAAVAVVHRRLEQLAQQGVALRGVALLGHSQGGAVALAAGLTWGRPLGGVFTIAGYLALTPQMRVAPVGTPYHLHHSRQDENVSARWADYAQARIQEYGEPCRVIHWDIASAPHQPHARQLEAICATLRADGEG